MSKGASSFWGPVHLRTKGPWDRGATCAARWRLLARSGNTRIRAIPLFKVRKIEKGQGFLGVVVEAADGRSVT
jgi:hypothetical protein